MTIKQLLTVLAAIAEGVPVAAPLVKALLGLLTSFSDKEFDLLKVALAVLPDDADIDAADARIYAKVLAEKLQSFPADTVLGNPKPGAQ